MNLLLQTVWGIQALAATALLSNAVVKNQGDAILASDCKGQIELTDSTPIASYTHEPLLNICMGHVDDTWLIWIPAMVFHLVMFMLLILKALWTPR